VLFENLNKLILTLKLKQEQKNEIMLSLDTLNLDKNSLFAVRSSSLEEDLENFSFAGG